MRFQNTKIDFIIKYNQNNKFTSRWSRANEYTITDNVDFDIIVPRNNLNELKAIKSNITDINNLSATLYFHKSAVFPRYKLQDSQFKRCIKIEKADYIVVSNEYKIWSSQPISNKIKRCAIIKSGAYVYAITESVLSRPESLEFLHAKLKNNLEYFNQYCDVDSKIFGEMEILYQGEVLRLTNKEELPYLYTIGVINKPFITDVDLDKAVSNKLTEITWEDIVSIKDMLSTKNSSTNDLGLKLLAGFNVYSYPRTVSTLLAMTNKFWYKSSLPVIVQSMLDGLCYLQNNCSFPACLNYIRVNIKNDQDREWSKKLLEDSVKQYVDNAVNGMKKILDGSGFNIEINAKVE